MTFADERAEDLSLTTKKPSISYIKETKGLTSAVPLSLLPTHWYGA